MIWAQDCDVWYFQFHKDIRGLIKKFQGYILNTFIHTHSKIYLLQNTFDLHLHSDSNVSRALPWHFETFPVGVVLSLQLSHSGLILCPHIAYLST